jgi:hypothetical protein
VLTSLPVARARTAALQPGYPLLLALRKLASAVALVWMAGPAMRGMSPARRYPSLPELREQGSARACCLTLPERFAAPANPPVLQARSAGAFPTNPRRLELLRAESVAVLVSMAGSAMRAPARRCPSLPELREQSSARACCPTLLECLAALSNRQALRAQERNRPALVSRLAESVVARAQAAALPVCRKQRRVPQFCRERLERFAAQIPWASKTRIVARQCSAPQSLREMWLQGEYPAGLACRCRDRA